MLVPFDPVLGAFDPPLFLPGDPQKIATTADGNWLEVAMRKTGDIRRVNLLTRQVTNETSLSRWEEIQTRSEEIKDQEGIRFTPYQARDLQSNQVLGTFASVLFHYHLFAPEVSARRFYQLIYDIGVVPRLRIFQLDTFRLLEDLPLPIPGRSYQTLSRWGETGFLLCSSSGFIVWRSRFVSFGASTDLRAYISCSPAQSGVNESFVLMATVTNAGPNSATNVSLQLWLPSQASLLNTVSSPGFYPVMARFSHLLSANSCIEQRVHHGDSSRTNAGLSLATALATSRSFDPNCTNDIALCSVLVTALEWPAADTV
jgi:hypothetical protein